MVSAYQYGTNSDFEFWNSIFFDGLEIIIFCIKDFSLNQSIIKYSVQEACAKCFVLHLLKFEILQKQNKTI